ncbi:sulfotransferase [Phycisphaeraceae bacterium D3-23]
MPSKSPIARLKRYLKRRRDRAALAARKRAWRAGQPAVSQSTPVLIVGCQRSGTTMLGRILDQMMPVDCFHETDRAAFGKDMRTLGAAVRRKLVAGSDAQAVLFKPICDSHLAADMMAEHGDDAKAIWIYRNWRDVTNSNVTIWKGQWKQVYGDLLAGRDIGWGWRHEGISDTAMQMLRDTYTDDISERDAASLKWWVRNASYFDQGLHERGDVLPVCYEELVTEPAAQFGRICRFLGIPFDEEAVATVFDKSIGKEEAPPEDPSVIAVCDPMYDRLKAAQAQWDLRFAAPAGGDSPA